MTKEEKDIVSESVNILVPLLSNIYGGNVIEGYNKKLLEGDIHKVINNMRVITLENKRYRYFIEGRINYSPLEVFTIDESYMDLNTLVFRYFEIKNKYEKEDIEYLRVFKYALKPFSIKEAITELEEL